MSVKHRFQNSQMTWKYNVLSMSLKTNDLKICVIIIIDRFYIALFSALEQTHCARMWFYMSE